MSLPFRAIPGYHAEAYCSACESWSPLERWNEDEIVVGPDQAPGVESVAVCPRCGHHHSPYDPPIRPTEERADVNDKTDRWSGFTDEELLELRNGCELRWDQRALPPEIRDRAGALVGEINRERNARRRRYRGPGVYRGNVAAEGASAPEYEVYGVVNPSGANRMLVVRADPKSDELVMVSLRSFERLMSSNQPSYEWVRPLPGREER